MQSQVLARALCVREMFEVYDATIRQAQKVHENADYQVSKGDTRTLSLCAARMARSPAQEARAQQTSLSTFATITSAQANADAFTLEGGRRTALKITIG